MKGRKLFLAITGLLGWFGLIAQLVLHMKLLPGNPGESLLRFFTFFTILTNSLVAVLVSRYCLIPDNKRTDLLVSPSLWTAVTIYIVFVGVIYNTLLRNLWKPTGLQAIVDVLLHTIIPVLMLLHWWIWVNKKNLQFKEIPAWALYPVIYCIVVLIRGYFSKWYPYPFLDVDKSGLTRVLINCILLLAAFLGFSLVFVFVGKRKPVTGKL
jgi:hypothetical protein